MRFAQFLSLLAVCPGFASRLGSKPDNNTPAITTENFPLKETDLTKENRAYCKKCVDKADEHVDHFFFYSWKIDVVDGEKRLIAQCAAKHPHRHEGFKASSAAETLDSLKCDSKDTFRIPKDEANDVKGVKFDFSAASDRCVDILPECEKCAKQKTGDFFWVAKVVESKRKIHVMCSKSLGHPMPGGWERSPLAPVIEHDDSSVLPQEFLEAHKDWCQKTFKDACGAPQAPTDQGKDPEAPTDGRGLLYWLMLFGVLVVVVVAAAAGLYLGCAGKADEDESTGKADEDESSDKADEDESDKADEDESY